MPIATTLGSVVTYYKGLPTIKSNNPVQYAKLLYLHYYNAYGH